MKEVKIWMGTTKGELMNICFDNDQNKLRNVDVALPQSWVNDNPDKNRFWYVMDYNKSVLGEVRSLKEIAQENNVKLIYP